MSTTFSALRLVLDVKAHAPCPMCGGDGWAGGDRVSAIPELHSGAEPEALVEERARPVDVA